MVPYAKLSLVFTEVAAAKLVPNSAALVGSFAILPGKCLVSQLPVAFKGARRFGQYARRATEAGAAARCGKAL